jgi:hypothetical protein
MRVGGRHCVTLGLEETKDASAIVEQSWYRYEEVDPTMYEYNIDEMGFVYTSDLMCDRQLCSTIVLD